MSEFTGDISDEQVEATRRLCATHGDHLAETITASLAVSRQAEAGVPLDDIVDSAADSGNEYLMRAARTALVANRLGEAILTGPASNRVNAILKEGKSRPISSLADDLADGVVAELGFRPDIATLDIFTQTVAGSVAVANHRMSKPAKATIESGIINKFTYHLAGRSDTGRFCGSMKPGNDKTGAMLLERIHTAGQQLAADYTPYAGRTLSADFFEQKLYIAQIAQDMSARIDGMKQAMPEYEADEEAVRRLGETNGRLAAAITRLRNYGVKPMVFPIDDILPDRSIVLHEYDELDLPNFGGEQPLAVLRIAPTEAKTDPRLKVNRKDNRPESVATRFAVENTELLALVDRTGEIWAGPSIDFCSLPMRANFEKSGKTEGYEVLRAKVLKAIFDATVPVTIVRQVKLDAERTANPSQPGTASNSPEEVINKVLLPRIRYLGARNAKKLRQEFQAAEKEGQQEVERTTDEKGVRWHEVVAHTVLLPPGAKPSTRAIALSKEKWGDDYELPPGRTFRSKHERGTRNSGQVIGHIAVSKNIGYKK